MSKDIKLMTFAAKKATKLRLAMQAFYPVKKRGTAADEKRVGSATYYITTCGGGGSLSFQKGRPRVVELGCFFSFFV
jgi:hypothetical protein